MANFSLKITHPYSPVNNSIITKEAFNFLKELAKNNNKEWFQENKTRFKAHEANVKSFYTNVQELLNEHDEIEKMKMFRIYRDVRFSKDKTPYKTHFAGSFSRLGAHLRGGYYLRIKPGESFVATGFWEPNKEDLFRIRKEFEQDASDLREILSDKSFKKIWGELEGDGVKTAPKGFDKEHPNIDLIKKKQFIFVKNFSDKEVLSTTFIKEVDTSFRAIRPYFDLMSDILTTNLNGESILD
ncbi:TIGR02453 family protein [Flagellimonas pacifica]|uniref:TIGR02453 family protein n=1 Tax=Flagellimonas pacifica TaxID=1247520 RepID=A0A285MTL8_9FLAO|nr:TIGR02453 family protein [Allomuricauda parva]